MLNDIISLQLQEVELGINDVELEKLVCELDGPTGCGINHGVGACG